MKLVIFDDDKLSYFDLPEATEPYFVVKYESLDKSINEIITLYSEDNKWIIKADYNITISSYGEKYQKAILDEYRTYNIHFEMVNKDIKFIVVPSYEKYTDISLNEIPKIIIGCGLACNIRLSDHGLMVMSCEIDKKEDGYYVSKSQASENNIYVNGRAIKEAKKINFGDRIFIEGLKIIWLNTYLKINNVDSALQISGLKLAQVKKPKIAEYAPTSETEHNLKLYDYKDLFFHTPIIKDSIEERVMKIESPPDKSEFENIPMILTMGSTAIIGLSTVMSIIPIVRSIASGEAELDTWLSLIMCILMIVICTLFPILSDRWQKNHYAKKDKEAAKKYNAYLDQKEAEINEIVKEQTEILNVKHLTLEEVAKQTLCKGHFLWSREITEDDFMQVRVGIGNRPAALKIDAETDRFNFNDNPLRDRLYSIANKDYYLMNVPFSINIAKNIVTPFIINIPEKDQFIKSIILQLMFYYSAKDLKLIIITNEKRKALWNDIKYSSHCWSDDKKTRYFATTENEMAQLSMFLEQKLGERIKDSKSDDKDNSEDEFPYRKYDQYYLVITDDYHFAKDAGFVNRILNTDRNFGISMLVFADNLKDLPSRLKEFTLIDKGNSGTYYRRHGRLVKTPFNEEHLATGNISKYAEVIGNIPIGGSKDSVELIPSTVSFLDMYGAGRVEHLNILSRWNLNDPTISLNAPMGYQAQNKLIGLDLHEKAHGPHGLIAGSTGSGKSEFIISYILSMAINYHPYEVQFVLIDYKGGGLAGAFEKREKGIKIPHLVGTITNLDKGEMHRTLVSIKSELERRQLEFNKARDSLNESTIDIYKYQRLYREGKVEKPIAHLFIISDEFAELKAQQPEFMDELISTARIGRSLGVHLILATQKPTGVVNDQIWSNSRFKVCLKVQTSEDSNEILKKPDAATIKETGRFYLQVGNDELYIYGQSAWAGDKYIPTDHLLSKVNDSIDFIGQDGTVIKSVNDNIKNDVSKEQGDQLTNIVQYLYDTAVREKLTFNSLWLPAIPAEIYLMDLIKKYNYQATKFKIEAILGEYDMPTKQKQGLQTFDITTDNSIFIGNAGSGKENLLTTIIFGTSILHTPQEVNFYILDFGAETLGVFSKMPHVGEVITSGEVDKVASFFTYLEKELKRRKEAMQEYGGLYQNFIRKSPEKMPVFVTIINGYENFMEICPDEDYTLQRLLRESSKYGMTFIFTTTTTTAMRTTALTLIENKALLQLNDPFDYKFILGAPTGMVPSDYFGRGISMVGDEYVEFQGAYISKVDMINDVIRDNANRLSQYYKSKAPEIKIMPKEVSFNKMIKYVKYLNAIPIGYDTDTIDLTYYNFTNPKSNLIVGKSVTDDIEFLAAMIDFISSLNGQQVNVFDFVSSVSVDNTVSYFNAEFETSFNELLGYHGETPIVNIMIGIGNIGNALSMIELDLFGRLINNMDKLENQYFIFVDNFNRIQAIINYPWFNNINRKNGIWVGELPDGQNIFDTTGTEEIPTEPNMEDMVYLISDGKVKLIKGVKEVVE